MGQSLLIDMNSGWYKHKTEVNDGLKTRNYTEVKGSLNALNAILPEEYRVIIDDDLYREKIKGNLVALCNHCVTALPDPKKPDNNIEGPTQIDYDKLKVEHLLLNSFDQLTTGKKYDNFWECPECKKLNRMSETKFRQIILRKPFYLQVVPEPPKQHLGIQDRNIYHNEFESWARNFLGELNAQAQRFRQEYKPKEGEYEESHDSNLEDLGFD